jgi:hypothetical protein
MHSNKKESRCGVGEEGGVVEGRKFINTAGKHHAPSRAEPRFPDTAMPFHDSTSTRQDLQHQTDSLLELTRAL